MKNYMPLLLNSSESTMVAFYEGRIIFRNEFIEHVNQACKTFPQHKYSINLCDDRYHFLVVFSACVLLKQVSLFPSSRAEKELERLRTLYPDNYLVEDSSIQKICREKVSLQLFTNSNFKIQRDQVVSIIFTSGSTGIPKRNVKTWGQLLVSAERVKQRFNFNEEKQHSIVATVPPQHMYGFETTIIYPLILGVAIHASCPFYPLDIQKALLEMPAPCVLVTTPLHLKACNSNEKQWPKIDFVISATAIMPKDVANNAEKILNTRVFEIYGCSETGAIATRQMTVNARWQLLNDYVVETINEKTVLYVLGTEKKIVIPDILETYDDSYFKLVGRDSDLVNIGGKRGSLSNLTNILKSIDGVNDAIYFLPDEVKGMGNRLAALVIALDCDKKKLRHELKKSVDSVFLPRPLIFVDSLPYNALGKLPLARLIAVLNEDASYSI